MTTVQPDSSLDAEAVSARTAAAVVVVPSVSVVICAYTEARWTDLCAAVGSVLAQSPAEVLVVVDHNDTLRHRVERAAHDGRFPGVTVLANEERRGLSGARNTGVAAARGDVVAFLDDDARAEPGWLAALSAAYAAPGVQGVGGDVVPRWTGRRPRWFPTEFDWVVGCTHSGMPRTPSRVRNFVGANMSLRATALQAAGGFRAELGRVGAGVAGCEETELCIRVGQLIEDSWLCYQPAAAVVHTVPPERATWSYFVRRCYGEGRSKALVSRMAGSELGLSSERSYLTSTVPRGVVRGLGGLLRGDMGGLVRAGAMIVGVVVTTAGYAVQRARQVSR